LQISAGGQPTRLIPELDMVKPLPEATVQVTPLTSDKQVKGPIPVVWL
jgi:hypothetical protein